jgi:predicted nucleotidyltransferase
MDRESATRLIERIVHAIEAEQFPARVRELHVFGSYARGAFDPGDLDLILIHDPAPELLIRLEAELSKKYGDNFMYWPRGQCPERKFESMMRRVMRRPGEKMDIVLSTSMDKVAEMGENLANAHRIMIWSDSDRNWRSKLDSITPDPKAGRHERAHFGNLKRFNSQLHTMVNVSEAISQGFLKFTRIDAEKVEPNLNPLYQHWYDWWVRSKVMGKNSMKLLRYGMWWLQEQPGQARRRPNPPQHDGTMYSHDRKYVVYFGNPPLYAVYQVCHGDRRNVGACLIPHFRREEPSEMFVFEQGDRTNQKKLEQIMRRV